MPARGDRSRRATIRSPSRFALSKAAAALQLARTDCRANRPCPLNDASVEFDERQVGHLRQSPCAVRQGAGNETAVSQAWPEAGTEDRDLAPVPRRNERCRVFVLSWKARRVLPC